MSTDSEGRLPEPPSQDLWRLPRISKLQIERATYSKPRRHVVGGRVVEFHECVEISVQTDGEIPVRALSPALYVGNVEIAENERVSKGHYRFFVFDEDTLKDGSMISLGWAGVPGKRANTKFRYRSPRAKKKR
jgi:hypothetical protein